MICSSARVEHINRTRLLRLDWERTSFGLDTNGMHIHVNGRMPVLHASAFLNRIAVWFPERRDSYVLEPTAKATGGSVLLSSGFGKEVARDRRRKCARACERKRSFSSSIMTLHKTGFSRRGSGSLARNVISSAWWFYAFRLCESRYNYTNKRWGELNRSGYYIISRRICT